MNGKRGSAWLPVLILALSVATVTRAGQNDNAAVPVPFPIGVADPAGKIAYVPGAKGQIESIQLESGDLLWTAEISAKPLVVWGKLLISQAEVPDKPNHMRLVVLDVTQKGKRVLESAPLVFPDWVSVGLTHGRTFSSQARVYKGDLLIKWQANAFYSGGARPTPEIEKAARKEAAGVAQVNLDSGKVKMLDATAWPADAKINLPEGLAGKSSQQYWTGTDWKTDLFVIGKTVSALAVEDMGGGVKKMSLKRWESATGKALDGAAVELMRGKELWPQVSLDRQHVFVHQALVKEQLPPGDYAWWVFSLETGKQLAKIPFENVLNNVTVLGRRAYFVVGGGRGRFGREVQPRSLRAVDLASGKTAWERPVEGQRVLLPLP